MFNKKVMCAICLFGVLSLTACGGTASPSGMENTSAQPEGAQKTETVSIQTSEPDYEKIEPAEAAKDLMEQYFTYIGKDYKAFSSLYWNTPEESIQSDFNSGMSIDQYDQVCYVPVITDDKYAYVNCIYYIVSGSYPDTHMDSWYFSVPLSWETGEWKIDFSQKATDTIDTMSLNNPELYPQGLLDAATASRNAKSFSGGNMMYLDSKAVYQGCSNSELRYAWQNEDGTVTAAFWIANGTTENIHYDSFTLSITDDELGTVMDVQHAPLDVTLRAGTSVLQLVKIPKEQVRTGNAVWGTQHSSLRVTW